MTPEPGRLQASQEPSHGRSYFSPAWLQRINTTLILIIVVGGMGITVRAVSKKYAAEVSVPGTYVKIRPEPGGIVEARAAPGKALGRGLAPPGPSGPGTGGTPISMEVTLADVASLVRLIEEVSKTRIVLLQPVARRVSLRVRDAPVEATLEALASAVNLTLAWRDGAYILSGCAPDGH